MKVLALDIGGTNTRMAEIESGEKARVVKKKLIYTKSIKNLSKEIKSFSKLDTACVAIAAPITGKKAKLTNADLTIDSEQLKKDLKLKKIILVNDFFAVGHGIKNLEKKNIVVLHKGKKVKSGIKIATGPGTGLGTVYILNGEVLPCETGWTAVGIDGIDDYALIDFLKSKYSRPIYYEDVLSGRGLIDIYDHLEIKSNLNTNMEIRKQIKDEPVHKAKLLVKYSKKEKLCSMALGIFTKFYARFVRDCCLSPLSSEVFLVGGISGAIRPYLKKTFMEEFMKHSIYNNLLSRVEINLVLDEDIGLLGAGSIALDSKNL